MNGWMDGQIFKGSRQPEPDDYSYAYTHHAPISVTTSRPTVRGEEQCGEICAIDAIVFKISISMDQEQITSSTCVASDGITVVRTYGL